MVFNLKSLFHDYFLENIYLTRLYPFTRLSLPSHFCSLSRGLSNTLLLLNSLEKFAAIKITARKNLCISHMKYAVPQTQADIKDTVTSSAGTCLKHTYRKIMSSNNRCCCGVLLSPCYFV